MKIAMIIALAMCLGVIVALAGPADSPVTVKGYVLDSACAFTKGLEKPISRDCALACAKSGSPLVILAEDGTIYWPIAAATPSSGQNSKLLPFAGGKVTATGKVYERGGSKAIVIEKIEPLQPEGHKVHSVSPDPKIPPKASGIGGGALLQASSAASTRGS
jgi:hypothetical protein